VRGEVKPGNRSDLIYPLAEQGHSPVLRLVNDIRGHTLEELDQLFGYLIVSIESDLEFEGETMNAGSPLPVSTLMLDPGAVLEASTAQTPNPDPDRQSTSNDDFIDSVTTTTTTNTSSDSDIVDSSGDWKGLLPS
ncbi:hypothetical protein CEP54_016286, partial [Fusarium duplospermum]